MKINQIIKSNQLFIYFFGEGRGRRGMRELTFGP